ncbi:MAG: SxtJ family membrane protein [Limisphaerales bacterium]
MNLREDIQQLQTDTATLRKFGLMVGGVFLVLGGLFLWRQKAIGPWLFWPGVPLVVLGAVLPRSLKYVYVAWMSLAFVLGFIVAHVILTLFFYLVVTPIGLAARLAGKDFLSLKLDRNATSYWLPRVEKPKSAADYERQF